ncbi:hypothetical protein PIROE2DRAFT_10292 [Piromyces sp. E2]|nr:hypothetical protein PIROE2DRAFT_10292 [Piromyces sp. E2]|eukprot:OUM63202.1 hypothetical protein PIROE2DRAFT_10292 [Piromyces sp. E2]
MATNINDEPDLSARLKLSSQDDVENEDERYIDEDEELDRALQQVKNSGKVLLAMYARMMGRYLNLNLG